MNSRKTEFLAGIFFLIGVAAVAYLAIVIGGGQFFSRDSYLLKARFQDVGDSTSVPACSSRAFPWGRWPTFPWIRKPTPPW